LIDEGSRDSPHSPRPASSPGSPSPNANAPASRPGRSQSQRPSGGLRRAEGGPAAGSPTRSRQPPSPGSARARKTASRPRAGGAGAQAPAAASPAPRCRSSDRYRCRCHSACRCLQYEPRPAQAPRPNQPGRVWSFGLGPVPEQPQECGPGVGVERDRAGGHPALDATLGTLGRSWCYAMCYTRHFGRVVRDWLGRAASRLTTRQGRFRPAPGPVAQR
jgi:hypothetical protein